MTVTRDLLDAYVAAAPADAGMAVAAMSPGDATALLRDAGPETAAALLQHMPPAAAARCFEALSAEDAEQIVRVMPVDELAALVRRCDPVATATLIDALHAELAVPLQTLLAAAAGTAGAAMDPNVPVVQADATAREVREYLKAAYVRLFDYVYVVDADRTLIGVVNLDALATAADHTPIRQVTRGTLEWLRKDMKLDAVEAHPGWQRFDVLPVVDADSRFLGVVRHRRLRRLLREGQAPARDETAMRTLLALGEVYWLGLCGLLQGLSTVASSPPADRPGGAR